MGKRTRAIYTMSELAAAMTAMYNKINEKLFSGELEKEKNVI